MALKVVDSPRGSGCIRKSQNSPWEPSGVLQSIQETPKPASNPQSLQEAPGVSGSERKFLVDTIFEIKRKIGNHYFFTILCFADV